MRFLSASVACLLVLGAVSVASAQEPVAFGVKAGVTFSNVSISASGVTLSPSRRTGLSAGAFAIVPLSTKNLVIQPEALVTMKGAEISESGAKAVEKYVYLDVPVLVRYNFNTASATKPFVFAGPVVSLLISAKDEFSYGGSSSEDDIKSDMKSSEFSLALGGGVEFGKLLVDARYVAGLTNIMSDKALDGIDGTLKNKAFIISLGMKF